MAAVKYPELQDAAWLRQKYERERLSLHQIAALLGCSHMSVKHALVRANIERRAPGAHGTLKYPNLSDPEWLRRRYHDEQRSIGEIAAELGCTDSGVLDAMRKLNIPRRNKHDARRLRGQRYRERIDIDEARRLYTDGDSFKALGDRYGLDAHLIKEALQSAGVTVRTKAEQTRIELKRRDTLVKMQLAAQKRCRPTGVRGMKQAIAKGTLCAFCGAEGPLERHHLNAVRSDDRPENFVPLCGDCHRKVEWFIHHATSGLREAYSEAKATAM